MPKAYKEEFINQIKTAYSMPPKWYWSIDPGNVPKILVEPPGPKAQEVIKMDESLIMQSFGRWYPLVIQRGYGPVVEDVDGNLYIDFNAGIAVMNVGHSHPRIIEAIRKQAEFFTHYSMTDFYYELIVKHASMLKGITPISGDKRVFYTNSGTESIEGSIKIVRGHFRNQRPYVIAFLGAFHGRTYGSMALTASKPVQRLGFNPMMPNVVHIPYPYPYRCPFGRNLGEEECGEAVLGYLEDWIFNKMVDPSEISAIFFEPIQGEGGYVVPPRNFFPGLRKITDKYGILLVDDEVQAGFGRTGKWFAIQHWGVEPDLIAMAKAIAAGLPLGAIVGRASIMDLPRGSHANTFGGNPVALAAGVEVINVILDEDLMTNAQRVGEYIRRRFMEEMDHVELIGDVRGLGLMIGVELVRNRKTKEYATKELEQVLYESFKRGVAVISAGKSTIRIAPPLNIPMELAEKAVNIIIDVIKRVDRERVK
ncbi:aspartate aminotransferase family protein [Vulcanisaeta souniana JCM 11219]|uniref:Aspartate aminotransferase family protein n=3 Tax=Vulcanisaeta souniana TaxID=164452 RepID=A0ABM8BQM9_9CREN|nr:aspartate aminotransferase family protein [Vulcanisaeta souniana JCM 11219]